MRAALRRLAQRAERRLPALTRLRKPEPLPIELDRRRIYIVPSAFGMAFSVLLLVMMVGALNYANNAALLLTCLLGAACASSMLLAFRTLDGLRLRGIRAGHAIAGDPLELALDFSAPRMREAVRLDCDGETHAFAVDGVAELKLRLPTAQRGWLELPRLRVWSTWPLGLFRAWSWLHPQQSVLVWPRPEQAGPPPLLPADAPGRLRPQAGEDLAALRDYRRGDAPRHIAWKASARHHDLLVKDFDRPQPRETWLLDWHALRSLDRETRIARLARWLGEAEAQGRRYSLHLPDERIDTGSGPAHYARCMSALAVLP
ncbi:DUF58 domain-containing protein [Rhodanobacter sp. DHG33]|uniref:DUF58 domain-containing protein n=1 Tax=Rhodanobacter sp. DHG33 TaxID=2775921 RepID=UPI0017817CCE|nr:DUF58 domain-containing protein [Rhodanobacter sp. DHG33]MBD8898213.1 DUF58 domain-containing protein [Rhodanobacter sp. DHG33]